MLPEIEFVRASPKPISPSEIAQEFPERELSAIKMSLSRAVRKGTVKKVSTGLYAHPKYVSPIDRNKPAPTPTPNIADWKTSPYAALVNVTMIGLYLDNKNNDSMNYLGWIRPELWRIMREYWEDSEIRDYAKYLIQSSDEHKPNLLPGITRQDVYRSIKDNVNLGGYGN